MNQIGIDGRTAPVEALPVSEEARIALEDRLVERIVRHGMQMPAILFLEMHRPLGFLAGQSLLLASGFLAPLFGLENLKHLAGLLEDRKALERLIRRIESSDVAG